MTYNFKSQALSTIIDDLPANEAWWVGTPSAKYIIPIEAVMAALEREALMVSPHTVAFDGDFISQELSKIARVDAERVKCGNTYNSGDNLSHNLCYYELTGDDGAYYIALAIHRAGDVRCNYTDFVIFQFDSWEACWETIEEVGCDFVTDLTVDGKLYSIRPETTGYYFDVWCADDEFQTELYPDDITDEAMAKAIREAVKE